MIGRSKSRWGGRVPPKMSSDLRSPGLMEVYSLLPDEMCTNEAGDIYGLDFVSYGNGFPLDLEAEGPETGQFALSQRQAFHSC